MKQLTLESMIDPDAENQTSLHGDPQAIEELNRTMAAAIRAVFQGAEQNEESSVCA